MGVLSAVVYIFNETAMHAKAQASNRMAKANRASHGQRVSPRTQAKVRVKKTRENPKGNPKEPKVRTKVPKAYKGKTSKTGLPGLENSKSETNSGTQESAYVCSTDLSWNDDWNSDEWNDGWSFDEWLMNGMIAWRFGCQCHQWSEAVRMGEDELEHRSCSEHIPIELCSRRSRRWNNSSYCQW